MFICPIGEFYVFKSYWPFGGLWGGAIVEFNRVVKESDIGMTFHS